MTCSILTLPEELITIILCFLVPDNDSLRHVCLVGSHTPLAIARPLHWRHVDLNHTVGKDDGVLERLVALARDPLRATCARSIRVAVQGWVHPLSSPTSAIIAQSFPHFVNITYLHVSCFGIIIDDQLPTADRWVWLLMTSLPALSAVRVDGCDAEWAQNYRDWDEELPFLPQLRSVDCRFCGYEVMDLWAQAPNLQDLYIESGDPKWWTRNVRVSESERFYGNTAEGIWLNPFLQGKSPSQFRSIVLLGSSCTGLGADDIFYFVENYDEPFPQLTTLILDQLSFGPDDLRAMLPKLCTPVTKVLKLCLWHEYSDADNADIQVIFYQSLAGITHPFEMLTGLEDLWLPIHYISITLWWTTTSSAPWQRFSHFMFRRCLKYPGGIAVLFLLPAHVLGKRTP